MKKMQNLSDQQKHVTRNDKAIYCYWKISKKSQ